MTALARESVHLGARGVRSLIRQPWYVAVTLVQPVIWLLLFSQLFKQVTRIPGFSGDSYVAFLTPGVIVMTCLFSSGWAGMGLITDMDRGVMDRFLVSPVRRGSLIAGALLYQALTIVIQSLIILGLGVACGARFPGGVLVIVVFFAGVLLLGSAFASYSHALALLVRREESVIGAVNFLVLPLSFLSATLMPLAAVRPASQEATTRQMACGTPAIQYCPPGPVSAWPVVRPCTESKASTRQAGAPAPSASRTVPSSVPPCPSWRLASCSPPGPISNSSVKCGRFTPARW